MKNYMIAVFVEMDWKTGNVPYIDWLLDLEKRTGYNFVFLVTPIAFSVFPKKKHMGLHIHFVNDEPKGSFNAHENKVHLITEETEQIKLLEEKYKEFIDTYKEKPEFFCAGYYQKLCDNTIKKIKESNMKILDKQTYADIYFSHYVQDPKIYENFLLFEPVVLGFYNYYGSTWRYGNSIEKSLKKRIEFLERKGYTYFDI